MAIGIHREADLALSERFHDDPRRDALSEQQTSAGVSPEDALFRPAQRVGQKLRASDLGSSGVPSDEGNTRRCSCQWSPAASRSAI